MNLQERSDDSLLEFIGLTIAFAAVVVLLISYIGATAAGVIVNAVLTIALIFIYTKIARFEAEQADLQGDVIDLQQRQTDILEGQEKLMEAGNKPLITVEAWQAREDDLTFYLRNVGKGVAVSLTAQILMYPPKMRGNDDEVIFEGRARLENIDNTEESFSSAVLPPDGQARSFVCEPSFHSETVMYGSRLGEMLDGIVDDLENVEFDIYIKYDMIHDERQRLLIWTGTTQVAEIDSIRSLVSAAHGWRHDADLIIPENLQKEF